MEVMGATRLVDDKEAGNGVKRLAAALGAIALASPGPERQIPTGGLMSRMAKCSVIGCVLGGAYAVLGCQASAQTEARAAAAPEATEVQGASPQPSVPLSTADAEAGPPLLGARHDLTYAGPPSKV